ncbi:hypothetical protein PSENEW3n2_00000881 [Picochlorum sp. SENEW3]|nr:hypothetical protein PSENEW3n2_00000881 [Picochlorum sp. SENEW3]WPT15803.1 hypothetical protein PSENEW3_00000881 [Picochlorum sp. SENEW3]
MLESVAPRECDDVFPVSVRKRLCPPASSGSLKPGPHYVRHGRDPSSPIGHLDVAVECLWRAFASTQLQTGKESLFEVPGITGHHPPSASKTLSWRKTADIALLANHWHGRTQTLLQYE